MSTSSSFDASGSAPQLTVADLTLADINAPPTDPARPSLLICLPPMGVDDLESALATIAAALPDEKVEVALPGPSSLGVPPADPRISHYTNDRSPLGWVLAAADYAAAALPEGSAAHAVLLLGDSAASDPALLRQLANSVCGNSVDLALPRFHLGPSDALVNSAILYPLTRALFGPDILFPLPTDAALSTRMVQRLAALGHRQAALGQGAAFLWPVAEAAVAGFSVRQIETAAEPPAISDQQDFNALFNSVTGSLFTDVEAKASFWQRARVVSPPAPLPPPRAKLPDGAANPNLASNAGIDINLDPDAYTDSEIEADIRPMIESFQLAQANLQEIWSLVLPPQSRLALKKLALQPPSQFEFESSLWARVVYDFVLAFHLRTLNRGHLLGALIPIYLAWVASHLRAAAGDDARSAVHTSHTATAFDLEKPYLVSRWRWPDRFNP